MRGERKGRWWNVLYINIHTSHIFTSVHATITDPLKKKAVHVVNERKEEEEEYRTSSLKESSRFGFGFKFTFDSRTRVFGLEGGWIVDCGKLGKSTSCWEFKGKDGKYTSIWSLLLSLSHTYTHFLSSSQISTASFSILLSRFSILDSWEVEPAWSR